MYTNSCWLWGQGFFQGTAVLSHMGRESSQGEVVAGEHGLACTDLAKGEGT